MGYADNEELRDAEIARRTMAKYSAQHAAILAGDKPTIKGVQESVLDYVCAVPLDVVMRQRLAAKEQALAELVKQVMLDIAEIEAIKDVERMEAGRIESGFEARAEQRQWHREFPAAA